MTVLTVLDRWRQEGAITEAQHAAIAALVRKDRWSVNVELNALLYLGIVSLVGGVGWTVTQYSARLGDVAILGTLTAVFVWSVHFCLANGRPFSSGRVDTPSIAFDYVLYLGCLILAVDLGYVESTFHPFGGDWDHLLLLASTVFFVLAYRFDNRLVLSLALSSLGAWFGVRVSHVGLLVRGSPRAYALAYGTTVAIAGTVLHGLEIKAHFLEAYLHVAANVLLFALASGSFGVHGPIYLAAALALSAVSIAQGIRFSRFAFVIYGVVCGYAAVTGRALRDLQSFSSVLAYFVISGSIVIVALVVAARQFGRDA